MVPPTEQMLCRRQQVAPIGRSIFQRIEAADQEGCDAEGMVIGQGIRYLLRGPPQRSRVSLRAEQSGESCP